MKNYTRENVSELFPYVQHSLRTICRPILEVFNFHSRRLFSPFVVDGLEELKELKRDKPDSHFIYISRHLSHMDYIETQLNLGYARIPARIQAGDNLFIGPFDPFWRKLGAFMAIREGRGFYSKNWMKDMAYSMMPKKVGPYKKEYELYVDKKVAKLLYESYLEHILSAEEYVKDLLVYPEYKKQPDGSTKYGRSYSGGILDFSSYLFLNFRRIISKTDKEFFFVAVNPSYERVVEDSFMIKVPDLKKKFSRDLVYLQEYAYMISRPLFPLYRPGAFVLKFGKPYPTDVSSKVKADVVAERLKKEVGLLQTPFSPQVLFHSMRGEKKVELKNLEDRVFSDLEKLDSVVDTSHLKEEGKFRSFDSLLDSTLRLFDAPTRRYVKVKSGSLEVVDERIVSQYANHIAHLF
ncbi:MAG: hypothetical protein ABIH63_02440 [archaeon]